MLGKRSPQRGMFEADHVYLDFVGRDSFYGFLATERGNLFRDEDFGQLYPDPCAQDGLYGQWAQQRAAEPFGDSLAAAGT